MNTLRTYRPLLRKSRLRNASPKAARLWRDVRAEVLKRDDYTCQMCGGRGTDVDHIAKRSTHPHLKYELDNLRVLCRECHSKKGDSGEPRWGKRGA